MVSKTEKHIFFVCIEIEFPDAKNLQQEKKKMENGNVHYAYNKIVIVFCFEAIREFSCSLLIAFIRVRVCFCVVNFTIHQF